MTRVDVVVARCGEDVSWAEAACEGARVFIYDKGGAELGLPLPNVGREAHTFLHHIAQHYHELADVTLFLQGHPFDHNLGPERLRQLVAEGAEFPGNHRPLRDVGATDLAADHGGAPHHPGLPVGELCAAIFPGMPPPEQFWFHPGAQYAVKREGIENKPLVFWQDLVQRSHDDPMFPWTMERLWPLAFA